MSPMVFKTPSTSSCDHWVVTSPLASESTPSLIQQIMGREVYRTQRSVSQVFSPSIKISPFPSSPNWKDIISDLWTTLLQGTRVMVRHPKESVRWTWPLDHHKQQETEVVQCSGITQNSDLIPELEQGTSPFYTFLFLLSHFLCISFTAKIIHWS